MVASALAGAAILAFLLFPSRISEEEIAARLPAGFQPDAGEGEILFHMGGCAACHRDEATATLAGGAPLETPFGDFYPSNISSDPEYGIGGWSDAEFITAMVKGVSPSGQHYYPAFPYTSYSRATYADLLHLKAYLMTEAAAPTPSRPNDLSFPFNIRLGNGMWKLLFADMGPFEPDPGQSDEWNRGAYIVNSLGHCSMCHTPRNIFQAEKKSQPFTGGAPLKAGQKGAPKLVGLKRDSIINGLDEFAGAVSEKSAMYHVTISYSNNVPLSDHDAIATYLTSLN